MLKQNQRYLTPVQAASYIGISRSAFDKLVKSSVLPKPIALTDKLLRWDKMKLDDYLERLGDTNESKEPDYPQGADE